MNIQREHAIEALLVLVAAALLQLPDSRPSEASGASAMMIGTTTKAAMVASLPSDPDQARAPIERSQALRIDPLALLQAGVPEQWRVELPTGRIDRTMTC